MDGQSTGFDSVAGYGSISPTAKLIAFGQEVEILAIRGVTQTLSYANTTEVEGQFFDINITRLDTEDVFPFTGLGNKEGIGIFSASACVFAGEDVGKTIPILIKVEPPSLVP